jgi:hypothetical protein
VPGPDFDGYWAERTAVEFLARAVGAGEPAAP